MFGGVLGKRHVYDEAGFRTVVSCLVDFVPNQKSKKPFRLYHGHDTHTTYDLVEGVVDSDSSLYE